MPMPVRSLPVVQNWDCHGCTNCCRTYHVRVSDAERAKLDALGWAADPDLNGTPPAVWEPAVSGYRLSQLPDGTCVFLGPDNRCRIHGKYGPAAKPAACRIFPFTLSPAGDHWRAGARFSCPSIAGNRGRPLPDHAADLRGYAGLLEAEAGGPVRDLPPAPLAPGQLLPWLDVLRFVQAIETLLADTKLPVELRVRHVLALAAQCRAASFDKVRGNRLGEFLDVMAATAADEVPADPAAVPPPGWIGRVMFRQVAALYARKDHGPDAGVGRGGKIARVRAVWRFTLGTGRVPRLHNRIPDGVTFEAAEAPTGPLPQDIDALLTRYYRVKIASVQFFGRPNFGMTFWDGLHNLLMTFPVILWLGRILSMRNAECGMRKEKPTTESAIRDPRSASVEEALQIVDDSFGFNPLLAGPRMVWGGRVLADRGELARLVARYGR